MLYRDYGGEDLSAATQGQQQDYVFRAARYAPVSLLAYFHQHHVAPDATPPTGLVGYRATVNQTLVHLFIRTRDAQLAQVDLLSPDDLLGDVTTTFRYEVYARLGRLVYPTRVRVEKVNGWMREEVQLLAATTQPTAPVLLVAPPGY